MILTKRIGTTDSENNYETKKSTILNDIDKKDTSIQIHDSTFIINEEIVSTKSIGEKELTQIHKENISPTEINERINSNKPGLNTQDLTQIIERKIASTNSPTNILIEENNSSESEYYFKTLTQITTEQIKSTISDSTSETTSLTTSGSTLSFSGSVVVELQPTKSATVDKHNNKLTTFFFINSNNPRII